MPFQKKIINGCKTTSALALLYFPSIGSRNESSITQQKTLTPRSIFDGTKIVHDTLLEKFKGVAREKYEFDYPQSDNSASFFLLRLIIFVFKSLLRIKKTVNWKLGRWNQGGSLGEVWCWIMRFVNTYSTFHHFRSIEGPIWITKLGYSIKKNLDKTAVDWEPEGKCEAESVDKNPVWTSWQIIWARGF